MSEIKEGIRYIFQTRNEYTFAISGSGHTGMESAICNILEPGDTFVCAVSGIWGKRAAEMGRKLNCKVIEMEPQSLGHGFGLREFEKVIREQNPKLVYVCHGDSSTGVLQRLDWSDQKTGSLGQLCHEHNCLLLVDAVASLLSAPLDVDRWHIDIAFSGSQKCLSAPPGVALITFSDRAMEVIRNRKSPVVSYYLDVMKMSSAWGCRPNGPPGQLQGKPTFSYHSTHAVSLLIGLREALSIVVEAGLEETIKKHNETSRLIYFHEQLTVQITNFYFQISSGRINKPRIGIVRQEL